MKLSKKKRRLLSKALKSMTIAETASFLNVPEKELERYIRNNLPSEKIKPKKSSRLHTSALFPPFFSNTWFVAGLLACLITIAYANSLDNAFLSDDIDGIVNNRSIGSLSSVGSSFPYVVQPFIYYLLYTLGGLTPWLFRLFSLSAHGIVSFLVYRLVCRISGDDTAFLAAVIFAVHPALTESVSWISGMGYVLNGLFLAASLGMFVQYAKKRSIHTAIVSMALYAIALATSAFALVFPFLSTAYAVTFRHIKKTAVLIGAYCLLSVPIALFLLRGVSARAQTLEQVYAKNTESLNPLFHIPLSFTTHAKIVIFPAGLTFYHSEYIASLGHHILLVGLTGVYAAAALYFWNKNRAVFFWLLFFPLSLLPVLAPVNISAVIAERYVYLGSIGLIAAASAGLLWILRVVAKKHARGVSLGTTVFILTLFSILTIQRNNDWHDQESFLRSVVEASPDHIETQMNLGLSYERQGMHEKARDEFLRVIMQSPEHAYAHLNLANQYKKLGKRDAALTTYERALSINPGLWQAEFNRSTIYYEEGDMGKAQEALERAVSLNPNEPRMLNNLGSIYLQNLEMDKAKEIFKRSYELDPTNDQVRQLLDIL